MDEENDNKIRITMSPVVNRRGKVNVQKFNDTIDSIIATKKQFRQKKKNLSTVENAIKEDFDKFLGDKTKDITKNTADQKALLDAQGQQLITQGQQITNLQRMQTRNKQIENLPYDNIAALLLDFITKFAVNHAANHGGTENDALVRLRDVINNNNSQNIRRTYNIDDDLIIFLIIFKRVDFNDSPRDTLIHIYSLGNKKANGDELTEEDKTTEETIQILKSRLQNIRIVKIINSLGKSGFDMYRLWSLIYLIYTKNNMFNIFDFVNVLEASSTSKVKWVKEAYEGLESMITTLNDADWLKVSTMLVDYMFSIDPIGVMRLIQLLESLHKTTGKDYVDLETELENEVNQIGQQTQLPPGQQQPPGQQRTATVVKIEQIEDKDEIQDITDINIRDQIIEKNHKYVSDVLADETKLKNVEDIFMFIDINRNSKMKNFALLKVSGGIFNSIIDIKELYLNNKLVLYKDTGQPEYQFSDDSESDSIFMWFVSRIKELPRSELKREFGAEIIKLLVDNILGEFGIDRNYHQRRVGKRKNFKIRDLFNVYDEIIEDEKNKAMLTNINTLYNQGLLFTGTPPGTPPPTGTPIIQQPIIQQPTGTPIIQPPMGTPTGTPIIQQPIQQPLGQPLPSSPETVVDDNVKDNIFYSNSLDQNNKYRILLERNNKLGINNLLKSTGRIYGKTIDLVSLINKGMLVNSERRRESPVSVNGAFIDYLLSYEKRKETKEYVQQLSPPDMDIFKKGFQFFDINEQTAANNGMKTEVFFKEIENRKKIPQPITTPTGQQPSKKKGKSGTGKGIASAMLDTDIQENSFKSYKMKPNGEFGKIWIDPKELKRLRLKVYYGKNNKGRKILDVPIEYDLVELLTKRYNPKESYSNDSVEIFSHLITLSDLPIINTYSQKKKYLTEKKLKKLGPLDYIDEEELYGGNVSNNTAISNLMHRLELLIGIKEAGNNSREVSQEFLTILQTLYENGDISMNEYEKMVNNFSIL